MATVMGPPAGIVDISLPLAVSLYAYVYEYVNICVHMYTQTCVFLAGDSGLRNDLQLFASYRLS